MRCVFMMPMCCSASECSAALGGALRENTQNVLGSQCNGKAGNFIQNIAARTVPPYEIGVDHDGISASQGGSTNTVR